MTATHFLFPRRIGRLSYLARTGAWIVALMGVIAFSTLVLFPREGEDVAFVANIGGYIVLYLGYFLPFILIPRVRDTGANPWWSLISLIQPMAPLIALLALFAPTGWWTRHVLKMPIEP